MARNCTTERGDAAVLVSAATRGDAGLQQAPASLSKRHRQRRRRERNKRSDENAWSHKDWLKVMPSELRRVNRGLLAKTGLCEYHEWKLVTEKGWRNIMGKQTEEAGFIDTIYPRFDVTAQPIQPCRLPWGSLHRVVTALLPHQSDSSTEREPFSASHRILSTSFIFTFFTCYQIFNPGYRFTPEKWDKIQKNGSCSLCTGRKLCQEPTRLLGWGHQRCSPHTHCRAHLALKHIGFVQRDYLNRTKQPYYLTEQDISD